MPTVVEAIANFLRDHNSPFSELYHAGMHASLGVANPPGVRPRHDPTTRLRHYRRDGEEWYEVEVPAMPPETEITFDVTRFGRGVSMSGWDWRAGISRWVGVDLDAKPIDGRVSLEPHPTIELLKPRLAEVSGVKCLTSTSGRGLHLHIDVADLRARTIQEHRDNRDIACARLAELVGQELYEVLDPARIDLWVCYPASPHLNEISDGRGVFDIQK